MRWPGSEWTANIIVTLLCLAATKSLLSRIVWLHRGVVWWGEATDVVAERPWPCQSAQYQVISCDAELSHKSQILNGIVFAQTQDRKQGIHEDQYIEN